MKNINLGQKYVSKSIESYIKTAIVFLIIYACFLIFKPFLLPVVWGAIIAIALYPLHVRLTKALNNKGGISALLITLVFLSLLVIPSVSFIQFLIEDIKKFVTEFNNGSMTIQSPPESVSEWPLVGKSIYGAWDLFSTNLQAAFDLYSDQIKGVVETVVSAFKSITGSLLVFIFAIIISGVFLKISTKGFKGIYTIVSNLAGEMGDEIVNNSIKTIRSVVTGVLGTAIIQTVIITVALFIFKVPAAPVLSLVCLFMAIAQLPVILLILPIAIYMFSVLSGGSAVVLSIWLIAGGLSDNFLKPMLLGRGLSIPMPVILIGAIGGMLLMGIIGLFIGAVVLAVGYQILHIWIKYRENENLEITSE